MVQYFQGRDSKSIIIDISSCTHPVAPCHLNAPTQSEQFVGDGQIGEHLWLKALEELHRKTFVRASFSATHDKKKTRHRRVFLFGFRRPLRAAPPFGDYNARAK